MVKFEIFLTFLLSLLSLLRWLLSIVTPSQYRTILISVASNNALSTLWTAELSSNDVLQVSYQRTAG